MSLINQVLNELESRGVSAPLGGDAVRAIPPRKASRVPRYAFVAVPLLSLLAAGGWYLLHTQKPASAPLVAAVPSAAIVVPPAPASATAASAAASEVAAPPQSDLHGKPLLAVAKAEEAQATEQPHKRRKKERTKGRAAQDGATVPGMADGLPLKQITPQQRIENEFAKASQATQEGRLNDALAGYEGVLRLDPLHHASRRALAGVLVTLKRNGDAERVLQEGLKLEPKEVSFVMLLARLQVERDAVLQALETLQAAAPYAEGRADYQAFVAVLMQRQNRHDEAVAHFSAALKLAPANGIWLMGLGISLQALQRNAEARDAYRRALATNSLNAQLQAFVQDKLKEL